MYDVANDLEKLAAQLAADKCDPRNLPAGGK